MYSTHRGSSSETDLHQESRPPLSSPATSFQPLTQANGLDDQTAIHRSQTHQHSTQAVGPNKLKYNYIHSIAARLVLELVAKQPAQVLKPAFRDTHNITLEELLDGISFVAQAQRWALGASWKKNPMRPLRRNENGLEHFTCPSLGFVTSRLGKLKSTVSGEHFPWTICDHQAAGTASAAAGTPQHRGPTCPPCGYSPVLLFCFRNGIWDKVAHFHLLMIGRRRRTIMMI